VRSSAATAIVVALCGKIAGVIGVADAVKEDSQDAISKLHSLGMKVLMLTGDNQQTAEAVAHRVGVDQVIAGVLPEGKADEIKKLQSEGNKIAMVGDGINDAPALATADIGMALGSGTDIAIDAADVVIMSHNLKAIPEALRLSRDTLRTIKQNLFWAFIYNIIGIPIAAGALYPWTGLLISPEIAALAMALSSVSVVTNSLRLRGRWERRMPA